MMCLHNIDMPRRRTRRLSPCVGWKEETCRRIDGCRYVKGKTRRYCRSKPHAHRQRPPSSRTRKWAAVVADIHSALPSATNTRKSGTPRPAPRASRSKKAARARRPPGERDRLLRLQGALAAELKVVAEAARRLREGEAQAAL